MAHWYIFTILLKKIIILNFEFKNLFLKCIGFFYNQVGQSMKDYNVNSNFP